MKSTKAFEQWLQEQAQIIVRYRQVEKGDILAEYNTLKKVVESDPKSVSDFKGGKEKALMALFGKCMKELKGNCDPQQLKVILLECVNNA